MAIRSSIVIVDAEEYGRAGVSGFNDFGVVVSFGVVVADFGVVEGDGDLFKTIFLVERLVLDLLFFVDVCHGLYCVFSGGYLDCFWWFCYFFVGFLDLLKLQVLFRHYHARTNAREDYICE